MRRGILLALRVLTEHGPFAAALVRWSVRYRSTAACYSVNDRDLAISFQEFPDCKPPNHHHLITHYSLCWSVCVLTPQLGPLILVISLPVGYANIYANLGRICWLRRSDNKTSREESRKAHQASSRQWCPLWDTPRAILSWTPKVSLSKKCWSFQSLNTT